MLKFRTIREIWSSVEVTSTETILQLNDEELVKQLRQQVESRLALSSEESQTLSAYISSKILLIRDLAESRIAIA